jgi:hypothetical protein
MVGTARCAVRAACSGATIVVGLSGAVGHDVPVVTALESGAATAFTAHKARGIFAMPRQTTLLAQLIGLLGMSKVAERRLESSQTR